MAESVGPRATEAFAAIGNETRLAILLALWSAYDPMTGDNSVPFSELRDAIGVRDSGQFSYHLKELQEKFIRKTDTGYQLRPCLKIVQTIIASAGFEDPAFDPVEMDLTCPLCEATVSARYRDERLFLVCTETCRIRFSPDCHSTLRP